MVERVDGDPIVTLTVDGQNRISLNLSEEDAVSSWVLSPNLCRHLGEAMFKIGTKMEVVKK